MSSFSTAGGGAKATTLIVPGRFTQLNNANIRYKAGVFTYEYVTGAARDAINITGSGVFQFGVMNQNASVSTSNNVTITIDGVEVINDTYAGNIAESFAMIQAGMGNYSTGANGMSFSVDNIIFNKSLVVNMESDVNSWYHYLYRFT